MDLPNTPGDKDPNHQEQHSWLELREGKQWSRLLYPNPVCFLCTTTSSTFQSDTFSNGTTVQSTPVHNVMVISWLTATNNHGRFMMSINKRRFTASRLEPKSRFVLCVPVKGMEELLRQVGSVSGVHGSKFPQDHGTAQVVCPTTTKLSKRQSKKRPRFPTGIPGLQRVSIGDFQNNDTIDGVCDDGLFAIQGTVAILVCRMGRIQPDADHYIGFGQVTQAHVQSQYWNSRRNLFCPQSLDVPPYLTFLGSQTFGHVLVAEEEETE